MNMNQNSNRKLPVAALARIDKTCLEFESAWQTDARPNINDFLSDASETTERLALLIELVALDVDYRRKRGEQPTAAEYETQFPNDLESIRSVLESRLDPTVASPASSFLPPTPGELAPLFPQLEILELIGAGGMGAVYKARQRELDRIVAIKILPREFGNDPIFAKRFSREAKAMAQLAHPNIVTVYDFGQAGDTFYIMMEYVDGTDLRETIRHGRLQPDQALAIVPKICDALQYAHDEGIVHRDIKPENILIDQKGRLKIADFGLSKLLGDDSVELALTGTHQVMGTIRYMAPEQMEGARDVDHRADIYSLGVVFYELLTGELPLGRFQPPSEKVQVDIRLDEIVLRSLEKEPARRYQHASEIKVEIENVSSASAGSELPTRADHDPVVSDWQAGLMELDSQLKHVADSRGAVLLKTILWSAWYAVITWIGIGVARSQFGRGWEGEPLPALAIISGAALIIWASTGLLFRWADLRASSQENPQPAWIPIRVARHVLMLSGGIAVVIYSILTSAEIGPVFALACSLGAGLTFGSAAELVKTIDRQRAFLGKPKMWSDPQWTLLDSGLIVFGCLGLLILFVNPLDHGLDTYQHANLSVLGLIIWLPTLVMIVLRVGKRIKAARN